MEANLTQRIQTYSPELQMQVEAGLIEPLTLSRCIGYYGCRDYNGLVHANADLKPLLSELKQDLTNYLVDKTELQVLKRSLQLLRKVNEAIKNNQSEVVVKNSLQAFMSSFMAKRAYGADHPHVDHFLTYEALMNLRLRHEQVSILQEITSQDSVEFQAPTGSGKSQVLVVLWLFLTSKSDRTAMMTTTRTLAAEQLTHLREVFRNTFGVSVQQLVFNRKAISDIKYLKLFNQQLKEAGEKRRVLLVEISDLYGMAGLALKQSLFDDTAPTIVRSSSVIINAIQFCYTQIIKFLEAIHVKFKDVTPVTLELVKILETVRTKTSIFIDESRECLNIWLHNRYAIGQLRPIETKFCKRSANLYRQILLHPAIVDKWNFDFLPHDASKMTLTEKNWTELQKELAGLIIDQERFDPSLKEHLVGGVIPNQDPPCLPKEDQLILYNWYRNQLTDILKVTFFKKYRDGYVLNEAGIALPMADGELRKSSEFGSLDCLLNLTIQGNLKEGITSHTITLMENHVRNQRIYNSSLMNKDPIYCLRNKMIDSAYAIYAPAAAIDSREIDTKLLLKYLNSEHGLQDKLALVELLIISTIKSYPEQTTSTNFSLMGNLSKVVTASATMQSDVSYQSVNTLAQPSAIMNNLLSVFMHSKLYIKQIDPLAMFNSIVCNDYNVIIDAEGYFRHLTIEEMKTMVFNTAGNNIQGFSYYDENGQCMTYKRGIEKPILRNSSEILPENMIIFIRKGKAIGSDTPMSLNARGIITAGRDMSENFFCQASGRMRGLQTGQTLDVLMTQEDATVIAQFLNIEMCSLKDALRYFKFIDVRDGGKNYFFSLGMYLKELIEKNLWKHIRNPRKLADVARKLKKVLIESSEHDPLAGLYTSQTEVPADQAVKLLKDSILGPLREDKGLRGVINISKIEKDFDAYVKMKNLPNTIGLGAMSAGAIVEIQAEYVLTEEKKQQEQQGQQSVDGEFITIDPAQPLAWDGNYEQALRSCPKT